MRKIGLLGAASALARGALALTAAAAGRIAHNAHSQAPEEVQRRAPAKRLGLARWGVVGKPRPASTYRANKPSASKVAIRAVGEPALLDRDTYRSIMRARSRATAGRWPGVGDPRAVRSIEALRAAEEAARRALAAPATKPRRAPRKPHAAPIPAPA